MSSARPFVTIAMPSYNEEPYIESCLRTLLHQDYPADRMEILVADGGSTDRTREIVTRVAAEDSRIRLLDNSEHRIQSYGMNLCMRESLGEFIVVCDVHAEYAVDYVTRIVEAFARTGADNVGGAQRPKARTWFQRALCAALHSPLGAGGAAYRSAENEGFVDTVFPGAYRRSMLEKVGLFDVNAVTNEDAELNQRILEAGGKVFLSRDVVVHYYPRTSFSALARQYYNYGDGRARTLLLHKGLPTARPLLPALGLLAGTALVVLPPLQPLAIPAAALYATVTGLEAVRVGWRAGLWTIPVVHAIFPLMHASHGAGFLRGLVRHTLRPRPQEIEHLAPRPHESAPAEPIFA